MGASITVAISSNATWDRTAAFYMEGKCWWPTAPVIETHLRPRGEEKKNWKIFSWLYLNTELGSLRLLIILSEGDGGRIFFPTSPCINLTSLLVFILCNAENHKQIGQPKVDFFNRRTSPWMRCKGCLIKTNFIGNILANYLSLSLYFFFFCIFFTFSFFPSERMFFEICLV